MGLRKIALASGLLALRASLFASARAETPWTQGAENLGDRARIQQESRFPFDGRQLTPGEIAMMRTVFGGAIDYPSVRLSVWKDCRLGCPPKDVGGNEIRMPSWAYEPDYSSVGERKTVQCVFFHEMTHIYQDQQVGGFMSGVYEFVDRVIEDVYPRRYPAGNQYNYMLDAKKHFLDYGFEQQAAIVEDYCLLKSKMEPVRLKGTIPETTELLPFFTKYLQPLMSDPEHFVGDYFERRRRLTPGPAAWPHG